MSGLHAALAPGGRAALQFYPTPEGARAALVAARAAGFRAALLIDMPHATRAKKLSLAVQKCSSAVEPPNHCGHCPLSWPVPACCACEARWHGGRVPSVYPPRVHGVSCCDGLSSEPLLGDATLSLWHERLRAVCSCHQVRARTAGSDAAAPSDAPSAGDATAPSDPPSAVAAEVASAREASLGRLQHHHMKYARRVLHALQRPQQPRSSARQRREHGKRPREENAGGGAATAKAVSSEAPPGIMPAAASSTKPSSQRLAAEVTLYLCGSRFDEATLGAGCESCLLLRLTGGAHACAAMCDALCEHLRSAGLMLEHANVRIERAAVAAVAAASPPAPPGGAPSTNGSRRGASTLPSDVKPLPVEGAAPHGSCAIDLDLTPSTATEEAAIGSADASEAQAGRRAAYGAQRVLGLISRLRSQHALSVCAMDVALATVEEEEEREARMISRARVSLALRGCFASGAGHATVEEAQRVDSEGWSAAVRSAVLAEVQA